LLEILYITWITDEALFHLPGYRHSQNTTEIQESGSLVCHADQSIIGLIIFEGTLGTITHFHIFSKFGKKLDNVKLTQGYFQQDGATHPMSTVRVAMIQIFSDNQVISRVCGHHNHTT
jgi:hypothetical protein